MLESLGPGAGTVEKGVAWAQGQLAQGIVGRREGEDVVCLGIIGVYHCRHLKQWHMLILSYTPSLFLVYRRYLTGPTPVEETRVGVCYFKDNSPVNRIVMIRKPQQAIRARARENACVAPTTDG